MEPTFVLTAEAVRTIAHEIRQTLTDALHDRGERSAELHLLTGSKSEIERTIRIAITSHAKK